MASDSLLLKPENARYSDLFTILFSPNLKDRKLVESSRIPRIPEPKEDSKLAKFPGDAKGEGPGKITRIPESKKESPGKITKIPESKKESPGEITRIPEPKKDSKLAKISGDAKGEGAKETSVSRKFSLKGIYSSIRRELVIRFSLWLQVSLRLFGAKVLNGIERRLNSGGQENDQRVLKFDTDIKSHDDRKYNAALTAMACEASYKTIDCIKTAIKSNPEMEFVGSYGFSEDISRCTIDAFVFQDKRTNTYVLVFRGTETFNAYEWCADFDVSYVPFHNGKLPGKVHNGFWNLLEESKEKAYKDTRNILKEALKDIKKGKLIITGHSLGGALAILFTAKLLSHSETDLLERLDEVHTFGQPRVGNEEFSHYMEQELSHRNIVYYRVVYHIDMVPRMPFDFNDGWFTHIAPSVQYDRKNNYQIFKQLPNKNYFSLLMAIPMRLSALFELIMSFTNGSENRKNLRSMILVLVSPGTVAHFVANYANATRESFPLAYELTDPKDPPSINFLFIISYIFIFFLFLIF